MLNKYFADKPILLFLIKFLLIFVSLILINPLIGELCANLFASITNWFVNNFVFGNGFSKLFTENQQIEMYFRYDNILNPSGNFLYITYDFRSHFYIPMSIYLSLVLASPLNKMDKIRIWSIGSILISLFLIFKFSILASNQLNNNLILDKFGKLIKLEPKMDSYSKFLRSLNIFFNEFTSIELRPILTFLIWGVLSFTQTNIKSMFFPSKN